MIISLAYSVGVNRRYKYFDTFEQMNEFIELIIKVLEEKKDDCYFFDLGIWQGKDEERIRKSREEQSSGDKK